MEPSPPPTVKELQSAIQAALRSWHSASANRETLLDNLMLVRARQQVMSNSGSPTSLRLVTNQVLLEAIEALAVQDELSSRVLQLRFLDDNTLLMVAYKLNISVDTVSRLQRKAIGQLTATLYRQEMAFREERATTLEARLPPPSYTRLFGFDALQGQLLSHLSTADAPWVVAVAGIGGLGKTALADATVRQLIRQGNCEALAWVYLGGQEMSGRPLSPAVFFESLLDSLAVQIGLPAAGVLEQLLAQVRQQLKSQPHLVVIDNLETDAQTAFLIEHLNDLARPSKFLLTSRSRPPDAAMAFHISLDELPPHDALALLRHHGQELGIPAVAEAADADLMAVYELTGGNPLALKLVASLLGLLPLPTVLRDLARSRPGPIEHLYRNIYWQSWQILSADARALLQAMPLVGETGGLPDYLMAISDLPEDRFWPAVHELRGRSLLVIRGTLHEKRYGIHRLTETFLRTEIIHWEA